MNKSSLAILIILFFNFPLVAASTIKIDDFEAIGSYFSVPDFSKKAEASIEYEDKFVSEGRHSLRLDFGAINEAKQEKAALTYETNIDLLGAGKLLFDVYNPGDKNIKAAVAICSGANWAWQESPVFEIQPGWSKGMAVDLAAKTWKTEKTGWKNSSALQRMDDVQRIALLFYSGKGPLYLDYVRVEKGEKTMEKKEITYKYFSGEGTAIKSFGPAGTGSLKAGEKAEFKAVISGAYKNAFDCSEISPELEIKNTKTGNVMKAPGFFDGGEAGDTWCFRFLPEGAGGYEAVLKVNNSGKSAVSQPFTISVTGENSDKYLKVGADKRHFEFSGSGKAFLGIGSSAGWASNWKDGGPDSFEYYFKKISAAGGNMTRVWMTDFCLGIEWSEPSQDTPDYGGIMQYSLSNSQKLDRVFELAEKYGIYLILTLGSYSELKIDPGIWKEERWKYNPYNIVNGGPCNAPGEFFTNETARAAYKNRLSYIVSRWGYSKNLLAYDIWNEVDAPAAWVSEMAKYIKEKDAGRHMVSTTYGSSEVYKIPEIDFTMSHIYGWQGKEEDLIARLKSDTEKYTADYDKPYFAEELGIDAGKSDIEYDKNGQAINMHNALWASLFAGGCATHLNWWWKEYIDEKNLYRLFTPLKKFFDGVDFKKGWKPAQISAVTEGARVIGLQAGEEVLLWCQNLQSNWYNSWQGIPPGEIAVKFTVKNAAAGQYKAVFYDTWDGSTIKEETLQAKQGKIEISVSKLKKDLAIKINKK